MDSLARRYGKWPHEVLELSPEHLALADLCLAYHNGEVVERLRRLEFRKVPVFNTFNVGG